MEPSYISYSFLVGSMLRECSTMLGHARPNFVYALKSTSLRISRFGFTLERPFAKQKLNEKKIGKICTAMPPLPSAISWHTPVSQNLIFHVS